MFQDMPPDKSRAIAQCRATLLAREAEYRRELASLDEASAGETKSSAGDKYETAREMIAQSRRLLEGNLATVDASLAALERMSEAPPQARCGMGSLLETSQGWLLVGASLGEVEVDGMMIRTLSLASPLGQVLKGRGAGDRLPWRGEEILILSVS
jgi:transcription elongation GreA/GreB family factor